ncbi:hypothetical protein [Kutzneria buriramensis]|uniref:Uncharacterized protein n=1 Tax=Kutzneria buriramensis TaxID=1045776 RepID=A0A3E0HZS2_9PSEU|nr:hypothetical protein [Kutzneria buriramensis]REH51776.1 hypothetical protein BCF44_103225 [Kutzneria buriramensis]
MTAAGSASASVAINAGIVKDSAHFAFADFTFRDNERLRLTTPGGDSGTASQVFFKGPVVKVSLCSGLFDGRNAEHCDTSFPAIP